MSKDFFIIWIRLLFNMINNFKNYFRIFTITKILRNIFEDSECMNNNKHYFMTLARVYSRTQYRSEDRICTGCRTGIYIFRS